MPNERNIQLLASLLEMAEMEGGTRITDKINPAWPIVRLATWLAGVGVLVPTALTDEECNMVSDEGASHWGTYDSEYMPKELRTALERIAKGEDPQTCVHGVKHYRRCEPCGRTGYRD